MMRRLALALASLAVVGGGCGSGSDDGPAARQPVLPAAVADDLVARSNRVALMLARGDSCAADTHAEALRAATSTAVASGRVPRPLQRQLLDAVTSLAGQTECTPPEPAATPRDGDDTDEEKGRGKGKDKERKDEEKREDKEKEKDEEKREDKEKEKDEKEEDE
jgi:hypothetical protein